MQPKARALEPAAAAASEVPRFLDLAETERPPIEGAGAVLAPGRHRQLHMMQTGYAHITPTATLALNGQALAKGPAAATVSSNVLRPRRGADTSTAMLPGAC